MASLRRSTSFPNEAEPRLWYGGEEAGQDVCIRLVRNSINDEVPDNNRPLLLLYVMVHSSQLTTCSKYFAAAISQRWRSKRKRIPQEFTFHVDDGDVGLYTDCFSRMYSSFKVGFKSVEYSLQLLPVATHLAYDDLVSSICVYLTSRSPWSDEDWMMIRSAVLSEAFPRGHAEELLELLNSRLTRDHLRPLIKSSIKHISTKEARDLIYHMLETDPSPTSAFEQEVVSVLNEEFKLLILQAHEEIEAALYVVEGNYNLISMLETMYKVLDVMVNVRGRGDEAVTWFARYTSFPRLLRREMEKDELEYDVAVVVAHFACTVEAILKEMVAGKLHLEDSDRYVLVVNWLPLLEFLYEDANGGARPGAGSFCEEYVAVRKAVLSVLPRLEETVVLHVLERFDTILEEEYLRAFYDAISSMLQSQT